MSNKWNLVWSEEFDSNIIDSKRWNFEVNDFGGYNNELQFYTDLPMNSKVNNGILTIIAMKHNYCNRQYTSARINTKGKFNFKYGRIEVCAKLPQGKGLWPAIWLLPEKENYGDWPLSGEIDIMENLGHDSKTIYGSIHYGDPKPNNKHFSSQYYLKNGFFSDTYHTFSVEWSEDKIEWFVDGDLYSTKTPTDLDQYPWRFDQAFYIILNLAVGGDWPGSPDNTTKFPQEMHIKYVRVYQIKDDISNIKINNQLLTKWTKDNETYYLMQIIIDNTTNKKIKDVIFKIPFGIVETWNCVVAQNTISLPPHINQNPLYPKQIYTFGGIFKKIPNFEIVKIIFE